MLRGHRSSRNETTTTLWRSRNADWWKDLSDDRNPATATPPPRNAHPDDEDPEAQGRLPSDADIYELTNAASMGKPIGKAYIAALQAQYTELFPVNITVTDRANTEVVYASAGDRHTGTTVLREFASKVQKMRLLQYDLSVEGVGMAESNLPSAIGASMSGVRDPLGGAAVVPQRSSPLVAPCFLSMEQYEILHHVLTHAITDNEQALTMVHAPGGCGKSHVVMKIADELAMRNFRLISTCPTGAGAVHMRNGRTFASALRTHIKDDLGPQQVAEMRLIFDKNVAVIVVDEVSMFSGENLSLLDRRLRQLYSPSKVFGGMSVLLVGDFLQLRVIVRCPQCSRSERSGSVPSLQSV